MNEHYVILGYIAPDEPASEYQTIPLNKIEDFGVHCKQYYSLDVTYFKSALDGRLLDSLWNTYWVNTLSATPLLTVCNALLMLLYFICYYYLLGVVVVVLECSIHHFTVV